MRGENEKAPVLFIPQAFLAFFVGFLSSILFTIFLQGKQHELVVCSSPRRILRPGRRGAPERLT